MDAYINLTGNLGSDVEVSAGDGWKFARFRLACTPRIRKQGEWLDDETTWVSVSCQDRLAENVAASLHKGDPVMVSGKLRTHSWVEGDGERKEKLTVAATGIGHDLNRGRSEFTKTKKHP